MTDPQGLIRKNGTIMIHWPRLGPYHVARLRAAAELLSRYQMRLIALEISGSDKEYLWERPSHELGFERHTLFPNTVFEEIPSRELFSRLWSFLTTTTPSAILINGYSTRDAIALLIWCRLKGCRPILMSESKADDFHRKNYVEFIKSILIRQFHGSLCGGSPHRKYLEYLGMPSQNIFDGYDAVDNQFFMEQSDMVRQLPDRHQNLPGLEDPRAFFLASGRFISRKNFPGLLHAYRVYAQICVQNRHIPWRLLLLGDGPEREVMEAEIKKHNLEKDVFLAGVQPLNNLPVYYGLASIFIHPALQDQWGLVVNEAMACGLPVLVSECAGCAFDLVEDGVDGFKFDPEDSQELASLMVRMSSGVLDLNRMGRAARAKISGWGVDRFAHGLLQAVRMGLSE
jgi:glycosyltransferase involved in cell wall biosynthesis